jgi:hypothetical protein
VAIAAVLAVSALGAGAADARPGKGGKPKPTPAPTATPSPTPSPTGGPGGVAGSWSVVSTGSTNRPIEVLVAVAAAGTGTAWAVGSTAEANGTTDRTMIQRWNGSSWTTVTSPNPDPLRSELYGVDALATGEAWAVGVTGGATGPNWRPLALRWTGSSWQNVTIPSFGSQYAAQLEEVAVVGPAEAWGVGAYADPSTGWWDTTFALRWDGAAWSRVPTPTFGSTAVLTSVDVVSATDVWAVGYALEQNWRTLALHWDGTAWSRVPTPNEGPYGNVLRSVAAIAPDDVWAVGTHHNGGRTLTLHWDGAAWSVVPSPQSSVPYTSRSWLDGVAASGPDDVWAVGTAERPFSSGCDCSPPPALYTLVLHWDGSAWSTVESPSPGSGSPTQSRLTGVAAISASEALAVGSRNQASGVNSVTRPLGLRYLE